MRVSRTLRVAHILPSAQRYQLCIVIIAFIASLFGILLLPLVIPIALWAIRRYHERLEVVLTQRDLQVRRGVLTHEEKTIPLEKITDLVLVEGPLMRLFGVKGLGVETAGQSAGGALVRITGIEDVEDFRDAVLEQRDRVSENEEDPPTPGPASPNTDLLGVLTAIRDTLERIEKRLPEKGGD
jgi:putative membrane protein